MHGDFDIDYFKNCPFEYIPVNIFPFWLKHEQKNEIVDYTFDKLFVSYNRMCRVHRVMTLILLYRNNLLNTGIVSFGVMPRDSIKGICNYHLHDLNVTADEIDSVASNTNMSPDNKNLITDNPANQIVIEHYTHSFVSLVTETLVDGIFFSEKIYKPIAVGHPFILIGGYKQLNKLKEFGFKTFSVWWNEEYDEIKSSVDRTSAAINVLTELSKKSKEELHLMREEMKPTLLHNQEVFNNIINGQYNELYSDSVIKTALLNILNEQHV
jgi:hypothetical protein